MAGSSPPGHFLLWFSQVASPAAEDAATITKPPFGGCTAGLQPAKAGFVAVDANFFAGVKET